jgi:hypothetical protein
MPAYSVTPSGKMFLSVHVDDIVLYSGDKLLENDIVSQLCSVFSMKNLGRINQYLGFNITFNKSGDAHVNQSSYIKRVLSRFNMTEDNTAPTPAIPKHIYRKNQKPGDAKDKPYREAIGSLLYAALGTRPDTTQAVSTLSQYNSNPSIEHWTGVKRVMRYLKGTLSSGLLFKRGAKKKNYVDVKMYSDANWAEDKDTRKSRSAMLVTINDTPVAWHSKAQPVTAMSSCESELYALCEVIKEALWLRQFLSEL